jgi:hypothetical protein
VLLFSWGRRASMPGIAKRLIGVVVVLGAVGLLLIFANATSLGLAAAGLLFVGVKIAGGLIAGMILTLLWARRLGEATGR